MKLIAEENGKHFEFEIPFTVEEITFGEWLDFTRDEQEYLQIKEGTAPERMISAISRVAKGDWNKLPFSIEGDMSLPADYTIKLGDDVSVVRFYFHICNLVSKFVSKDKKTRRDEVRIQYDGSEYVMKSSIVDYQFRQPLSTVEFVEFLELERLTEEARKKLIDKNDVKVDSFVNLEFRMTLKQMALLLRKEGEQLPEDKGLRDQFIKERASHFQGLPLTVVFAVRSFFLQSTIDYIRTRNIGSSLSKRSRRERSGIAIHEPKPRLLGT